MDACSMKKRTLVMILSIFFIMTLLLHCFLLLSDESSFPVLSLIYVTE